ncbi:MAG: alpha-L-glutamate ligase-like protein [Deltaproteobacteria bacterium]|nr:alpha-L-glutamate ligase-like protein [Deltaproteobacteria bacterium]
MWNVAQRLAALGVMGINRRNADFTLRHNPRRYYPLVDDKLRTKELAIQAGIPVPELYLVVEKEFQVRRLAAQLQKYQDFVIKPANGSGGDGILVITSRVGANYRTAGGELLPQSEIDHHVFNTLSGLYSLRGSTDQALIEYRVDLDPCFEEISYLGVPDIRIIVFLGVPVMAMLRLPTRMSTGKANLHQGAIGVGVDLATGVTLGGTWRNETIREHPDTGSNIHGVAIPHWDTMLRVAARSYELTHLGYLGVDMVLDRQKGPMLLELNARPGLAIQIANRAGLLPRIQRIEAHHQELADVEARVAFAKREFGVSNF